MLLNQKKTKNMTFNFTNKFQFATRLQLSDKNLESIDSTKLLGTIISNDLKWNMNTKNVVKKANARMQILRKAASFGASIDDLKLIYYGYVRNRMEQSSTVWHSSLTGENNDDLERIQKTALKIILKNEYNGYKKSLKKLDMETLSERRKELCLKFAIKCTKNEKMSKMFPINEKTHQMKPRVKQKFKVNHANTARLKKFSIIYMQNLLNET